MKLGLFSKYVANFKIALMIVVEPDTEDKVSETSTALP